MKVDVSTLLVVALVALGIMTFVSFSGNASEDVTGAPMVGGGGGSQIPVNVYGSTPGTVIYEPGGSYSTSSGGNLGTVRMLAEDSLEFQCEMAKGKDASSRAKEICKKYGVVI